jgi:hypothetical protein
MKTHLRKISLSFLSTVVYLTAFAQPTNDNVCDALAVTLDALPISIDNAGATFQTNEIVPPPSMGGDPCFTSWCNGDPEVQNSVWFTFVAPLNGAVEITTCLEGTEIDTQLGLYQSTACDDFSAFVPIAANDDIPGDCSDGAQYASALLLDGLTPGETYHVQVDGTDGEEGIFEIQILTGVPKALVNFIHNSADAMLEVVDIRVNGELVADDILFRTCTGYIEVVAGEDVSITINPDNSSDDSEAYYTLSENFNSTLNYVATVYGIYSESGYTPAPSLSISVFENAQIFSETLGVLPLLLFHGVTDAPTVDVNSLENALLLSDNLTSGAYSAEGYINITEANFTISLSDENGNPLGIEFCAPFAAAAQFGFAFTVVASGFLNPAVNSNGPDFGIFVVNHFDGTFIELSSGACQFPTNDEICAAANLIVNDPPSSFDNTLASVQENESSPYNLPNDDPEADCVSQWCDGSLDATLWFTFIAPASGNVMVTTCFETTFDTQVTICSVGDCNDFQTVTYLASNDDAEGGCSAGDTYASTLYYTGLTAGNTYHIQLDGWEGSSGPFDIQVLDAVGVANANELDFDVFPNPAKDQITISGLSANSRIEIRDVAGRLFYASTTNPNGTIDTSSLASGVYTLIAKSDVSQKSTLLIIE